MRQTVRQTEYKVNDETMMINLLRKNLIKQVIISLLIMNLFSLKSLSAEPQGSEKAPETVNSTETQGTPLPLQQIKAFADAFIRIKHNYIEPVSDEKLLEYAIEGMLSGLDPHSVYLKNEKYERLNEGTTGSFSGLGMEVIMDGGFVKVIAPIDDTPAAKAGIKTGDLIIKMDGKTVSGLNLREATEQMRGEVGTTITLTLLRESESDPIDITLTRALVRFNSVKSKRLSDKIGYLRVSQFQTTTAESFRTELKKLRDSDGFSGLILDLRNNPGGLLSSAISIADVFIEEGEIVSTKGRHKDNDKTYNATNSDLLEGKPIIVLINAGSASASEIVAGALQDSKRALLLGTDTFGKASVQTVMKISEEEAIKLTTARYYTPSGRSIQAKGITPDVMVEYREFKKREKGYQRIKENDLPGHLENDRKDSKKTHTEIEKPNEIEELLAKDYQLNEAFNVLNGLILYQAK